MKNKNKFKHLFWILPLLALLVLGVIKFQAENAAFDVSLSQCNAYVGTCVSSTTQIKSVTYDATTRKCNFNMIIVSSCSGGTTPTTNRIYACGGNGCFNAGAGYGKFTTSNCDGTCVVSPPVVTPPVITPPVSSCEEKLIGQKYCTGSIIYQTFQDTNCGTTERQIETCGADTKCVNAVCEVIVIPPVITPPIVVVPETEGLDMQTFGIVIGAIIVIGAVGFVYYNKSKKKGKRR